MAGTIFHKSRISLVKWFEAIHMMYVTDGRIPGKMLGEHLGVAYKSSWRVKQLLMEEMGYTPDKSNRSRSASWWQGGPKVGF